jgi:hypothetical protein
MAPLKDRLSRVLERVAWNAHADEEPPIPWRVLLVGVLVIGLALLYRYELHH